MIEGNEPCICEHIKDLHDKNGCKICDMWIQVGLQFGSNANLIECGKFKLDNLAYLEKCYECHNQQ